MLIHSTNSLCIHYLDQCVIFVFSLRLQNLIIWCFLISYLVEISVDWQLLKLCWYLNFYISEFFFCHFFQKTFLCLSVAWFHGVYNAVILCTVSELVPATVLISSSIILSVVLWILQVCHSVMLPCWWWHSCLSIWCMFKFNVVTVTSICWAEISFWHMA